MPFILDSSVALAWILPDETNPTLDHLCDRLTDDISFVPPVWPLEVATSYSLRSSETDSQLKM